MTVRAAFWALLYALLVFLPMLVLLFAGERVAGRGVLYDFAMGLGFAGMAMFAAQFALTARFRRATHPFGIDVLYYFHRILAIGAVAIVFGHWLLVFLFFPDRAGPLDPREAPWEISAGRLALGCFALLVLTSEFRKRLGLEYGLWRYAHVALAVTGFLAAVAHIGGVGHYTDTPLKQGLWLGLTLGFLGLLAWTRIGKPLRQMGEPWRIVENRPERGGAFTLTLEPEGHTGFGPRWIPGQFAWLTLRASPFALREHPFSIATAPEDGPRLSFGIKPLGDFTEMARDAKPGERVFLDGPYGVFSVDHAGEARGFVFVAGGIGITPILANLRAMAARGDRRPAVLFFCNPDLDAATYREVVEDLGNRLDLRVVHVVENPPDGWTGESGLLDRAILQRHLPADRAGLAAFLCGPPPLTEAARKALAELGVPERHIDSELFELV